MLEALIFLDVAKAMIGLGREWDKKTLAGFLTKPKKDLESAKMAYAGLRKKSDIAKDIAYPKSLIN